MAWEESGREGHRPKEKKCSNSFSVVEKDLRGEVLNDYYMWIDEGVVEVGGSAEPVVDEPVVGPVGEDDMLVDD